MKITRRPYLSDLEAETVIVHTKDDRSIRGVMVAAHSDAIVLRQAAYLMDESTTVSADGEIGIPRENIAFYQRIGAQT
jgi:small nuclear ribonucleoprotein (snRNP)-like protein